MCGRLQDLTKFFDLTAIYMLLEDVLYSFINLPMYNIHSLMVYCYLCHIYLPRRVKNVNEMFFCLIKYLTLNLIGLHHVNIAVNQIQVQNAVCVLDLNLCVQYLSFWYILEDLKVTCFGKIGVGSYWAEFLAIRPAFF